MKIAMQAKVSSIRTTCLVYIILTIFAFPLIGQDASTRTLFAKRVDDSPKIDGVLDEAVWENVPVASEFTEFFPNPFASAEEKTEVRILYDDKALYIGARLYDSKNKILKQLSVRDVENVNADKFEVLIDPFESGQNAWVYGVTSAGVQFDSRLSPGFDDISWDGVWISSVKINNGEWVVEMKIPYSSIRFPDRDIQRWKINFKRTVRRTRTQSFWNPVDPEVNGLVRQFGNLSGIEKVIPPPRLALIPYLATYSKHVPNDDRDVSPWDHRVSGGLDIKYGINESLTLDMSIIPDFGQVPFDDLRLNLTPFELHFEENRPFFTEGTEIFNRADIFYSRRVGGEPLNFNQVEGDLRPNETIVENPEKSQLINALKISGRNRNGLGVGFFNAISRKTFATIEFGEGIFREYQTDPLTNYNVIVLDQLISDNSFASFINTNVIRGDGERDANVTGTEFRFAGAKNNYAVSGKATLSQVFTKDFSGDLSGQTGYAYNIGFGKVSGNFLFDIRRNVESDDYDPNDLGFLFNPNEISHSLFLEYRFLKPTGPFNSWRINGGVDHTGLYEPSNEFSDLELSLGSWGTLKNFLTIGLFTSFHPIEGFDFFEPRVEGEKFRIPPNFGLNAFFSSDYRKVFALDGRAIFTTHPKWDAKAYSVNISPRIRASDRLIIIPSFTYGKALDQRGYTDIDSTGNIIFAIRDRQDVTSSLTATLLFSNKMNLSIRGRHNWTLVENNDFFNLNDEGNLDPSDYSQNKNINFNAFNIDVVYRFRFAPGSEINLVWKNSILSQDQNLVYNFFDNFSQMFDEKQENVFSFKFLYYLDYLKIQRKRRSSASGF